MKKLHPQIAVINAGSSSIKFAVYDMRRSLVKKLAGSIVGIGSKDPEFIAWNKAENNVSTEKIKATDFDSGTRWLIEWMQAQQWFEQVIVFGHRIVHGMRHAQAEIITDDLLKELNKIKDYDPDHLPAELQIIHLLRERCPSVLQVACFDTAFHTTIPEVAKKFAIPKSYYDENIQRYGFHGISYTYLMQALKKQDKKEARGKIILAHLGNGASLAAVKNGKCIDTSMGFTPAGGIVMSTRSGDLDPGIAWYLMQKGMDAKAFNNLINHKSGLFGISGISSDMQDLLKHKKDNQDARLAIDIFCYHIKKFIGGYAATLAGLDVLVFSGGIGEHSPIIRSRICKGLQYLGIELNEKKNKKNEWLISRGSSAVKVYVIPTDEELMIAQNAESLFAGTKNNHK
ncbi:MAG: acetate/propionate family kinase [Ginsengibacter sp.]